MKRCIINTPGPIAELGFISGPITNPCKLEMDVLRRLVKNGREVYEVNPENPAQKVLLTIENYDADNFSVKVDPTADVKEDDCEPVKSAEHVKETIETAEPKVEPSVTKEVVEDDCEPVKVPVENVKETKSSNNKNQKNKKNK